MRGVRGRRGRMGGEAASSGLASLVELLTLRAFQFTKKPAGQSGPRLWNRPSCRRGGGGCGKGRLLCVSV